jgi:DNA invertase Pin-like site-specific DNA recombinase
MTLRAALYARFSTENQNPTSVADQLALCRTFAGSLGAHVVREFSDAGISGSAMGNRPGVRELMAFVERGGCDLVIAEHTDRLSRAGSDGWAIFEDIEAMGVRYVTVNQGDVSWPHRRGRSS